jgi:DNA polymerase I-like protein with 3'-5' exonuclease and polymerase domains
MSNDEIQHKYVQLLHAMQAGVAMEMELSATKSATEPKHLRVGINSAHISHAALVSVLIKQGVIKESEYLQELLNQAQKEVETYEARIHSQTGKTIKLGSFY